jgi:hypothetical protein
MKQAESWAVRIWPSNGQSRDLPRPMAGVLQTIAMAVLGRIIPGHPVKHPLRGMGQLGYTLLCRGPYGALLVFLASMRWLLHISSDDNVRQRK